MRNFYRMILVLAAITVISAGCGDNSTPMAPQDNPLSRLNANSVLSSIPADAAVDSARFYIHTGNTDSQTVTVHQVTASWEETEVTWDMFAAAFDTEVFDTLFFADTGWYSVDITSQALGWFDSTLDNYGFLFQQNGDDTSQTVIDSRESGETAPFLVVCYTTFEGASCDTLEALADAYIASAAPEDNFGEAEMLTVGAIPEDTVYQGLLQFEFPVEIRYASVGDWVFNDENMNGLQDEGESGLADIVVKLYGCEDTMLAETMTDEFGYYMFDSLEAGDYYLEFVNPNGWVFTYPDEGDDDAMDSDVDRYGKTTACFTLMPGMADMTLDAGLFAYEGCTYSKGYWKNHCGFGPQDDVLSDHLPIWLGDEDGDKSMEVADAQMAVDILQQHTYNHPSNGITKLYAQLLAAKLNIANFANPADIQDVIGEADSFLAGYDWNDWDLLDKEEQQVVLDWKDMLDQYNNGIIGPGHCDDEHDDDYYDDDKDDE